MTQPLAPSPTVQLAVGSIRTDGGTQARAELHAPTVAEYVEAMARGVTFPPIVVYHDGAAHWLADGFHRLAAARQRGQATIATEVRQGTRRDAVLHACGANATHGLRRTNADKRRAVETLLRDREWQQWSNQEIGRRCGVDPKTVASVRQELESTGEIPSVLERQTADGRMMNTTAIGGAQPSRPLPETVEPGTIHPAMAPLLGEPAGAPSTPQILVEIDESNGAADTPVAATPFPSAPAHAVTSSPPARPAPTTGPRPMSAPPAGRSAGSTTPPAPAPGSDPLAARKLLVAKRALLLAALADVDAELERTRTDTTPHLTLDAQRARDAARFFLTAPGMTGAASMLAFSVVVTPSGAEQLEETTA